MRTICFFLALSGYNFVILTQSYLYKDLKGKKWQVHSLNISNNVYETRVFVNIPFTFQIGSVSI